MSVRNSRQSLTTPCRSVPALPLIAIAIFAPLTASVCHAQSAAPETLSSVNPRQAAAEIISENVVCRQPKRYIGWPTIVRAKNGDLLIAFSGDRDWHVDPWGKVFVMRSSDGGKTWSAPKVVFDSPLDDRDSGLSVLPDGTIVLSTFTSLAFDNPKIERYRPYRAHAASLTKEAREQWLGNWILLSHDDGKTWGAPRRTPVNTPHGPTALSDGRLLLVRPGVYESRDQGATWKQIAMIAQDPATWKSRYDFLSEQHAVEASPGHIVALSRYADKADVELRQMESADGGATWSAPRKTGMQGYPAHLLRLANGWLLATYSRRIPPLGERACVSRDGGKTWRTDEEIVLSNAVKQDPADLGYPSSVQLPDGSIWSVYYQIAKTEDGEYPCLMATHWKLRSK